MLLVLLVSSLSLTLSLRASGDIEIALMFTTDTPDSVHASKEEEEDNEVEVTQAKKGNEGYVPPPRVLARKEKQKKKKQQALDAGQRLKLLKELFYDIAGDDKTIDQTELSNMLASVAGTLGGVVMVEG